MMVTTVQVDAMEYWCQCAIRTIAVTLAICYVVYWFYTEIVDYRR